jgi:hypothetical protein
MDELALLKDFRLEDASADGAREHARAALQAAMTRRRLPRRRYAIVVAFAVAALLAAAAYAIVHEFIIGAPAPKDVNAQVAQRIGAFVASELIPLRGQPLERGGRTRIGAAAQTSHGRVYLLLTPLQGGGVCETLWFERDRTPEGHPALELTSTCFYGKKRPPGLVYAPAPNRHAVPLIFGHAPGAVRVRIGQRLFQTPFGWFVAPLRGPEVLTAYGVSGGVVAQRTVRPSGPSVSRPKAKPNRAAGPNWPVGPRRVLISTYTGWTQAVLRITNGKKSFEWRDTHQRLYVAVAPATNGGRCLYVYVGRYQLDPSPGCGFPRPRANEIQIVPIPVGWAANRQFMSILVLLGQAGANIARTDVRFSDGRSARARLRRGVVFYQVRRLEYRAGHRPVEVVARDANGHVLARKHLPFVR